MEFLVDGQVVPVARDINARPGSEFTRLPATSGSIPVVLINLPPSIAAGAHTLTFRYSGDAMFLPHQETHEFTVVTARGPSYMCLGESTNPFYFRANVVAQANVPSSAARGTTIDLDNLALAILTDRSYFTYDVYFRSYLYDDSSTQVGDGPSGTLEGVRFTVNGSAGTATGVTRSNSYPFLFMGTPYPAPEPEVDHVIALDGESGTFQLDAAIGDVVPVTLDSIELDLRNFLGTYRVSCTPVGEPAVLGQVRVAGVELAVTTEDPGAPVRVGDEVTLTADTKYPDGAGVAEFRDGTTTIGVAPLVDGTASMTTDDLPVGGRSLTVRVFPNPAASMLVSSMVPLPVLPAHDCEAFALEGSGAVVRLVFMELLGRCPDQAGFDYWTGRLDGGTSPEAFARAISATPEAVGMVVDDAYVTMLGRKADAAGKAFWVERMRTGSGRYDQLLADLAGSTEFWSQSGSSNVGFVGRVYEQLLDRAPDQAGQDFWVGRLDAGISPRALILQLANLDEPLGVLVGESYLEILGRVPVAGERGSGITFLRRTGDRSGFYAELIGTPEFADRAQDFPNPED